MQVTSKFHISSTQTVGPLSRLTQPGGGFALDFWRALQLHHSVHWAPPVAYRNSPTPFESHCMDSDTLPRTHSTMYALLISPPEDFRLPYLTKWETNLGQTFAHDQARQIIQFALKSSVCTHIQECNCKLLTRWYHNLSVLSCFFPETSDRCRGERGTLPHIFWACPGLETFWREVCRLVQ